MIKVCIWMNIPSHYQSAFYEALRFREEIDLEVCYFNGVSANRAAEGWSSEYALKPYEASCEGAKTPQEMVRHVPDWKERVHVVSSYFSPELVGWFCENDVQWCHWSEMPGVRLAGLLGYRMGLFRLLNPFMLMMKRSEGARIRKHALGAFGQGRLARRAFGRMGVPSKMMADLFYAPSALPAAGACNEITGFSEGRKVFLSVGALCERKGIDVVLKAFVHLNPPDWCVVFCGLDKENGKYGRLAKALGIEDRVLFLGAWPSDRMAEVYAASDVFVLPSRFDGWGAVLNEAASAGLPLIGTDLCGGAWHAVRPGRNGCRVRAGSVAGLANAMKSYVDNPELLKPHGETSAQVYAEELTPAANAERLVLALKKWGAREG